MQENVEILVIRIFHLIWKPLLSMEFSKQENGLPFPFQGFSPPRGQTQVSCNAGILLTDAQVKP